MLLSRKPFQSKADQWILDECQYQLPFDVDVRASYRELGSPVWRELKVHDEGFGEWHLIGGYMMPTAAIRADNESDVLEIYLEECVPAEDPEDEEDWEHGFPTGNGSWYSEVTMSYVVFLSFDRYEFRVEVVPKCD